MSLPAKLLYLGAGFVLGALCAWDVPAAFGHETRSRYYTVRVCAWHYLDGSCHYTYHRRRRAEPYRAPSRVYSYEHRERDRERTWGRCRETVRAVGEERYGTDRAKESALANWMETVRREPGARYMDPKNAEAIIYECGRSSTGNRASEKTQDVLGRFLEQCEVRARPCRADKEDGAR